MSSIYLLSLVLKDNGEYKMANLEKEIERKWSMDLGVDFFIEKYGYLDAKGPSLKAMMPLKNKGLDKWDKTIYFDVSKKPLKDQANGLCATP